ncbi:hypothetical protein MOQ_008984, partial [Trypanosoma cruzi marinkellei]
QLSPHGCGLPGRLRRGAVREVAAIMTAWDTLARHMSVLRLRRHVVHSLQSCVPANSGRRSAKDLLVAAMGQEAREGERGEPCVGKGVGGLLRPRLVVVTSGWCHDRAGIFVLFTGVWMVRSFFCCREERVRAVHLRAPCGRTVIRGVVADVVVRAGVASLRGAESEVPQFVVGTAVHGLTVGLAGPLRDTHMRALARQCR